ncbi:MAG: Mov34/MPN/PAD-1 family protein [Phycisphaeraceae bacterium]
MPLLRTKPLPVAQARGRLIVPKSVTSSTRTVLQDFHGPDGRHEGLVYWLGRRLEPDILVVGAVIPACEHGPHRVMASAAAVGAVARAARARGLGVVAQVHSHGGDDTRHSDGDDVLVLMPVEGMFSLVVGRYGEGGITPQDGVGVHQYQDGRWVQIPPDSADALVIVPTMEVNRR